MPNEEGFEGEKCPTCGKVLPKDGICLDPECIATAEDWERTKGTSQKEDELELPALTKEQLLAASRTQFLRESGMTEEEYEKRFPN